MKKTFCKGMPEEKIFGPEKQALNDIGKMPGHWAFTGPVHKKGRSSEELQPGFRKQI